MTIREIIRIAVLKTNAWWPFRPINRWFYALAINRFLAACRGFPEIRSIYLRHPLRAGQWTPALSDIDVTVVTDPQLGRNEEFAFLRKFWARISRLQAIFPMLGEIEVLTESSLETWVRFGMEGRGAGNWQLLAGENRPAAPPAPSGVRYLREAFNYAFWFYLQDVTRVIARGSAPAFLRRQDLLRLQRKIGRCIESMNADYAEPASSGVPGRPGDAGLILGMLEMLEIGLQATGLDEEQLLRAPSLREQFLLRQARAGAEQEFGVDGSEMIDGVPEAIASIYLDGRQQAFVILRSTANSTGNRRAIEWARDHFAAQDRSGVYLTERLFAYMLRFLNPFDHAWFIRQSECVHGKRLLDEISPPDMAAFEHNLLEQTPLLLLYAQSQEFLGPDKSAGSGQEFGIKWQQAAALMVYLAHGEVQADPVRAVDRYGFLYPRQFAEFQAVQSLEYDPANALEHRRRFELLKNSTDDIRAALSANDSWEQVHWA